MIALPVFRRMIAKRWLWHSMAARAKFFIHRLAPRSERLVDWIGIPRWLCRFEILGHAQNAIRIEDRRVSTGAKRSGEIALIHGGIVTVPMQLHSLSRPLIPHGREVTVPH